MSSIPSWDIFCRAVDNFGDVGVCWRLARQLATEQGAAVRVWVDDLATLHMLWPDADAARAVQSVAGVEVHHWTARFAPVQPARVVVEAFGCGLPEAYLSAMAVCDPQPIWITLEYLSAEPWVKEHHGLPSPHPRWPVRRYFFFPGFVAGTGGVLREADLVARRASFGPRERGRFWNSLGFEPPAAGSTVVSMFAYEHAPWRDLFGAWEQAAAPLVLALPHGDVAKRVLDRLGVGEPEVGRELRHGSLEVRILPFVEQPRYDELLWACDCNFVRGEDSFVRAQWAARPLVWHIYPQQERAHWAKLDAFLDLYCMGLPGAVAAGIRGIWRSWNGIDGAPALGEAWHRFWAQRSALDTRAETWSERLAAVGDLASGLARFCADRLK